MDIDEFLEKASVGTGIARLARVALQIVQQSKPSEVTLAATVVLERLFRVDAVKSHPAFSFVANELERIRLQRRLPPGDELFIDIVRAACLTRMGAPQRALALIDAARRRLRTALAPRWMEVARLAASSLPRDLDEAVVLRAGASRLEESFEVLALEVLRERESSRPSPPRVAIAPERVLVLVIEDDDDVRECLALLLEGSGFTVVTAENGAEAVTILEEGARPAAIVLDLMMPVMSGWAFRNWQQRQTTFAATPTIVFTASGMPTETLGEAMIMRKTASPSEVVSAVAAAARPSA